MKVLHLLDSLNRGGAEMLALDVCCNAARNELDLTFVATGGGKLETEFAASGVEFISLNRRLPLDFQIVRELRQIIKKREINVVHAHQAVEAIHAYFAALGTKTKLVLTFHGYVPNAKNRLTLKFLIPRVAANVVVSREFLNRLGGEGYRTKQNFHVIYNGVDERRLKSAGGNLKNELNLPADALLCGMISNFYRAPRKDQMTVCRALPKFFGRNKNAHFVFVGAAEDDSNFADCVRFCRENQIADKVSFLGVRTDIADVLRVLDVFVLSSLHEGLPISIIEAMLARVPCVLSDIAPLVEISNNGEFAEIFQTGNADELTEKLLLLAENADWRKDLSRNALRFARKNFSIETHLESLKKLYQSLI